MRIPKAAPAVLVVLAAACAPDPTEALVSIDVDEELKSDLRTLKVIVEIPPENDSGVPTIVQEVPIDVGSDGGGLTLPYVVALVPRDGDARRTWSIEAQAIGATPGDVTVRTLRGSYRPDAVTRFDLRVEACGTPCAAGSYCLDLACAPGMPR